MKLVIEIKNQTFRIWDGSQYFVCCDDAFSGEFELNVLALENEDDTFDVILKQKGLNTLRRYLSSVGLAILIQSITGIAYALVLGYLHAYLRNSGGLVEKINLLSLSEESHRFLPEYVHSPDNTITFDDLLKIIKKLYIMGLSDNDVARFCCDIGVELHVGELKSIYMLYGIQNSTPRNCH